MAAFTIKVSKQFHPNTADDQASYFAGIKVVLGEELAPFIENDLKEAENDIHRYPGIWSKTSRLGATDIHIENELNDGNSIYEISIAKLKAYSKQRKWLSLIGLKDKLRIRNQLNQLKKYQAEANTAYLYRLRLMTAELLLLEVKKLNDNDLLVQRIEKIKQLTSDKDLRTASSCLKWTKEVNALRNAILALKSGNQDLDHYANQLSIVTKRWIDPYYEHPLELTKTESARRITRSIIANLSCALAIAALVLFFFNPGIAFIVGVTSAIGMLPVLDDLAEVARNAWHGRAPTKQKMVEVGIALFIIFSLTFCAYVIAEIGVACLQAAPKVAKGMIAFGEFMATTFMRFIDAILNTINIFIDGAGLHDSFVKKKDTVEEKLNKNSMVWVNGTLNFLETGVFGQNKSAVEEVMTEGIRRLDKNMQSEPDHEQKQSQGSKCFPWFGRRR